MRVEVDSPAVVGDTVVFRWTQSEPNPFQYENTFFFRYEGIDLTRFSSNLFYELFLGLQLRIFAAYDTAVEVVLPDPVPRPTVAFWTAYHQADRVSVTPIAEAASYCPWPAGPPSERQNRPVGVFFGGGKDSMLTACLLAEIRGPASVVLFQFVHPGRNPETEFDRLTTRQETLMLRPARENLGVSTQRAWTDYMAQIQFKGAGRGVGPHVELYSLGFLPALLDRDVSTCTPGLARTAYHTRRTADGRATHRYEQSRPEMLAAQSRHYQRTFGAEITVTNLNFPFSPLLDFRLLAERYPPAVKKVVMCTAARGQERWCYQCSKCAEYVFYSLRCGVIDPGFDYDRFLAKSRYVARLIAFAVSGVELSVLGNAPWTPHLSPPAHYLSFCHAIAHTDPGLIADRIGRDACANLALIKALFGNTTFPGVEMVSTKSCDLIGSELAYAVMRIASEHFAVVDDLPGPFLYGNDEITYDFGVDLPPAIAQLDHLRSHAEPDIRAEVIAL
jgi:hypothetical protein